MQLTVYGLMPCDCRWRVYMICTFTLALMGIMWLLWYATADSVITELAATFAETSALHGEQTTLMVLPSFC